MFNLCRRRCSPIIYFKYTCGQQEQHSLLPIIAWRFTSTRRFGLLLYYDFPDERKRKRPITNFRDNTRTRTLGVSYPLLLRQSSSSTVHEDGNDAEARRYHVTALGENWTGAFGTGKLKQVVVGHNDEEDEMVETPIRIYSSTIFDPQEKKDYCVSAGWGHSAVIDPTSNTLRMAGQPHDWQKLFRYRRMPAIMQSIATSFESLPTNVFGETISWLMKKYSNNELANREAMDRQGLVPIQQGDDFLPGMRQMEDLTENDWERAEQYSFMNAWEEVPTPEPVVKVVCSTALTGVLGESGRLYVFGQNFFGQCGTGRMTSTNIWLPEYPVVRSITDDFDDDFHLRLTSGNSEFNTDNLNNTTMQIDESPRDGYNRDLNNQNHSQQQQHQQQLQTISSNERAVIADMRMKVDDEYFDPKDPFEILFVRDFDLGLQHGVAVDDSGRVYCWGKGDRGQLGQKTIWGDSCAALRVAEYFELESDDFGDSAERPKYRPLGPVKQVASGMLHCAALSYTDQIYVWGKNVLPPLPRDKKRRRKASDSKIPYQIPRHKLPDSKCLQISCGSHHTAMLFEDGSVFAVGISTDTKIPLLTNPVELIAAGVLDLPVRYFSAHMDRTTVVGRDGQQVLQVQLWEDPELRACAIFTPAWLDKLLEEQPKTKVEQVHRSWLHSLILTSTPQYSPEEKHSATQNDSETTTTSNGRMKD